MKLSIVHAAHVWPQGQTSVRVHTENEGPSLAKATLVLDLYKYQPYRVNEDQALTNAGLTFGELPPTPAWLNARYADYATTEDIRAIDRRARRRDAEHDPLTNPRTQPDEANEIPGEPKKGLLVPRRVAQVYVSTAIPEGRSVHFLAHAFTGSIEPWDFLRIQLLDAVGELLLSTVWTPGQEVDHA